MVAVQFNPLLPEVRANPYPLYHQLREEEPVHWSELMEAWVLTRYDDVSALLKDSRFSADRRKANNRFAQEAVKRMQEEGGPLANATTMLGADPPEHTRLRGLVSKAFTPRVVEAMRPHIQEIVDSLLDDVQENGHMDIIGDLAYPLPVIVIAEMLGVPPADRDDFKRWSDDIVATLGPLAAPEVIEQARISIQEMADYFSAVIAERRREPREDLLSGLIAAEERGEVLSEEELLATCILLLAAGNETTTNLIGNGMLALLRHPEQLEKLRDQPSLTESAIEEFLRYDGPVQSTARVATEQLEIRGKTIEEAQLVIALLGAANHDPEQFPNPDELDIARQPNQHIAFGQGIHFCIGSALARMEGQIAFETLLRRMPNPRLESEEIEWGGTFILRGLKRLPIAF